MSITSERRLQVRSGLAEFLAMFDEKDGEEEATRLEQEMSERSDGCFVTYIRLKANLLDTLNPWQRWTDGKDVLESVKAKWMNLWSSFDVFNPNVVITPSMVNRQLNLLNCFYKFVTRSGDAELVAFAQHNGGTEEATALWTLARLNNCKDAFNLRSLITGFLNRPGLSVPAMEFALRMSCGNTQIVDHIGQVRFARKLLACDNARLVLSRAYFTGCGVKQSYTLAKIYGADPSMCVANGYREAEMAVCLSIMINPQSQPMFRDRIFILSLRLVCKAWNRKILACNNFWSKYGLGTEIGTHVIDALCDRHVKDLDDVITEHEGMIANQKLKISTIRGRMREIRKEKRTAKLFITKRMKF